MPLCNDHTQWKTCLVSNTCCKIRSRIGRSFVTLLLITDHLGYIQFAQQSWHLSPFRLLLHHVETQQVEWAKINPF